MTAVERIAALRRWMRKEGLAAYWVPSTDPHASEYVPKCWRRRAWLSGFTGSAGEVVVTLREAGLWTDSRYFLQAERQLDPKVFSLHRVGLPETESIEAHLIRSLRKGQVLGIDPRLVSQARAEAIERELGPQQIAVRYVARNLVDALWKDRPRRPELPITRHADRFAGERATSKLKRVRKEMDQSGADALVITELDAIAWLFNIRGNDVEYNPLAIAHAIVTARGATLFLDPEKIPPVLKRYVRTFARIQPYTAFGNALRHLARQKRRVLADPKTTNRWVFQRLKSARIVEKANPITVMKAAKNPRQVEGMRQAHIRDGVALVRFFHWLDELPESARVRLTELGAAQKLAAFRAKGQRYRGESFSPIVGWKGNGAVVHYDPATGPNVSLRGRGLLLIDTGGQYLDGTTDVTRTVLIGGEPTRQERDLFTRVLQGHIRLAMAHFPPGTVGSRLEILARGPLWDVRREYLHGTGHGVGHYLNVHEGPMGFHLRNEGRLAEGNVLSNEPGIYERGKFGIRTENMVVVVKEKGKAGWLALETITLCPIDCRLIDRDLLTEDELLWLNRYHARVRRTLSPHLAADARRWLRQATQSI